MIEATKRPVTETSEFLGRIASPNEVNVVARVAAFLDKRLYNEGAEVKTGELLYFVLGLLPLVIATGAAQISRRAVGTAVFGGSSIGIFLVPMLYDVSADARMKRRFGAGL